MNKNKKIKAVIEFDEKTFEIKVDGVSTCYKKNKTRFYKDRAKYLRSIKKEKP